MQELLDSQKDLSEEKTKNNESKLSLLSWRKKASILQLRLASEEEEAKLSAENSEILFSQLQQVHRRKQLMQAELTSTKIQLQAARSVLESKNEVETTHEVRRFVLDSILAQSLLCNNNMASCAGELSQGASGGVRAAGKVERQRIAARK